MCTHLIDSFVLDAQNNSIYWQSFSLYLESLNPTIQRLLGNLADQEVDVDFWIAALQSGIVVAASDGLVKDGKGTYAVIFKAGEKELRFQGPVDCHPSLLQLDYSQEEIECEVIAHVDNTAAVTANNQDSAFPGVAAHMAPDIDVLQEIWTLRSITKVQAVWVEAHQDTKYLGRELTPEAVLNCT
eukprot:15349026-Ditylum_brightwellii.AAC.1